MDDYIDSGSSSYDSGGSSSYDSGSSSYDSGSSSYDSGSSSRDTGPSDTNSSYEPTYTQDTTPHSSNTHAHPTHATDQSEPVTYSYVTSDHSSAETTHHHKKNEENNDQLTQPVIEIPTQNDNSHHQNKNEDSQSEVDDAIQQMNSQVSDGADAEEKKSSKKTSKNNLSVSNPTPPQRTPRPMLRELKEQEYKNSIRKLDTYKSFMRVKKTNESADPKYSEILETIEQKVENICKQAESGQLNYRDAVQMINDEIKNNEAYNRYVLENIRDKIVKTDWKMGFFQTKHEITLPDQSKKQVPRKVSLIWDEIRKADNQWATCSEARKYIHNVAKSATKQDRWSEERTENYRTLKGLSSSLT